MWPQARSRRSTAQPPPTATATVIRGLLRRPEPAPEHCRTGSALAGGALISAGALFGLAAAISWGAGDFCGGLISRYASVLLAMLASQGIGFIATVLILLVSGEPVGGPGVAHLGRDRGHLRRRWARLFYLALSRGTMGLVAPLAALIGAGLPVLLAIAGGEQPDTWRLAGIGLALVAVVLISMPTGKSAAERRRDAHRPGRAADRDAVRPGFRGLLHRYRHGRGDRGHVVAARGSAPLRHHDGSARDRVRGVATAHRAGPGAHAQRTGAGQVLRFGTNAGCDRCRSSSSRAPATWVATRSSFWRAASTRFRSRSSSHLSTRS